MDSMARSLERESVSVHLGLLTSSLACVGELLGLSRMGPHSDLFGLIRACGIAGLGGSLLTIWGALECGWAGPRVRAGIALGACAALVAAVVYVGAVASLDGS